MPILLKSAGTVTAIWGQAFYHLPDGKLVPVKVGDKIDGGEAILTSQDGIVKISPDDGPAVLLKTKVAVADADRVITGLENNELDVNPAAGLQGGAGGGLQPGLRVDRVSESVDGQEFTYGTDGARGTTPLTTSTQPLFVPELAPAAPPPVLRVIGEDTVEGQVVQFHVQLSAPASESIRFTLELRDQDANLPANEIAQKGVDYENSIQYLNAATGQWEVYADQSELVFAPGQTEVLVRVQSLVDPVTELTEYVILNAHVTGGVVQNIDELGRPDASSQTALTDNTEAPVLSIAGPAVVDEAAGSVTYTVVLTHGSSTPITVDYAARDGSATQGGDYNLAPGTLTFAPGETSKTITVGIVQDAQLEGEESFDVVLSNPFGAVLGADSVTTAIHEAPVFRVIGQDTVEGQQVQFSIELSSASSQKITFSLALRDGIDDPDAPENEVAKIGEDTSTQIEYLDPARGTWLPYTSELSFEPGVTQVQVRVVSVDDQVHESTEYFILDGHVTSGAVQNVDASGQPALVDNDGPPLTARIDPASDSGPQGDGVTSDTTPAISGTGAPGAAVQVTMPGTGEVLTAVVQPDGTWSVTPTQALPDGSSGQVQVVETDSVGNTTQTSVDLTIDTTAPNNGTAPTVTITEDANDDGFINKAELNGAVDVKIAFAPAQVSAGDVVKVTSGGVTHDVTISDTDKANGFVTSSFAAPADGTTMVVNAVIVDKAGNVSANGSDKALIDTTAPNNGTAPLVTITEDANDDGFINKAELNGAVDVKIAFSPAQVSAGDVVKVTSGGVTQDVTITDTDKANGFVTSSFVAPADGTTMVVDAVIVDKAGNVSANGSDKALIDTTAPNNGTAPTVTITEDANDDGFINKAELNGAVDVKIAFAPAQVSAGDVVKVTSGGVTHDVTITDTDKANGFVTSSFTAPADGTTMVVNAVIVDKAGNVSANGSDEAQIDITAPNNGTAPTVTITEDANDDGFINKTELNGAVDVKIAFSPAQVSTGDVVKVTSAGVTHDVTISDTDKANGFVTSSFAAPADGTTMVVNAVIVDKAGNVSDNGSDKAQIDTTSPIALTAQLDPASDSGTLGDGRTNDTTPTISGTGEPQATIKVVMPGTNEVLTTTVQNDGTWTVTPTQAIANGTNGPAQVTETDAAGNTTQKTVDLTIDTVAPNNGTAPTVTITEDANDDGFINKAELNGAVDVKIAFAPAQVSTGDVVKVTSGGVTHDVTITDTDKANGFVTSSFTAPADGTTMVVDAIIVDKAGNVSANGSDEAQIDTVAPNNGTAPTVTITEDANDDGFINKAELNGAVDVKVAFAPTQVSTGDVVKVTSGGVTHDVTITDTDKANGFVTSSFAAPADGTTMVVDAVIVDKAGNVSANGSDEAQIDTVAPNNGTAPTVTITEDANDDGFINKAELNGAVDVKIAFAPAQVSAGDVVKVTSGGVTQDVTITDTDKANGFVTSSFVAPADGTTMVVDAVIVDKAGNVSANGSDKAQIDTVAPNNGTAPTVTITEDANNDGFINKAELNGAVDVKIAFTPAQVSTGDVVKVTSGGVTHDVTISDTDKANGFVTSSFAAPADGTTMVINAVIVDKAGNVSANGSDKAQIDTTSPIVLAAQLDPASDSGTLGDGRTNDTTPTISGTGEPQATIKVVMPGTNEVLTTTVQNDGTWTVTPTQAIANGTNGPAQVTETDAAGNTTQKTVDLTIDTVAPNNGTAPTVTITEDANDDGFINKAELNGAVDVKVAFAPAQVSAGDVVKVTSGGVTHDVTITDTDKANGFVTSSFTAPADGTTMVVDAVIVDKAGNVSANGSDEAQIDTVAPNNGTAPTVTITEDANDDGFINKAELNGAVDVKIAFMPTQVSTGDVVKVTSAGVTHDVTITDTDKANGFVTSSFAAPADGTTMVVNAVIVDKAGNVSANGSDSAKLDTVAPNNGTAPTVTITEDANDDGFINKAELNGAVDVKIAFAPAQVSTGDVVKVTSGGVTHDVTITDTDKANGFVTSSFTAPADGTTMVVNAVIVDKAGNVSANGSDEAQIDTTAPNNGTTPTVTITEDANDDGFINKAELNGAVDVKVAFAPALVSAGDVVKVTSGGVTHDVTITDTDKANGFVTSSFTAPADGTTMVVDAIIVDKAGNVSANGSDEAQIDTVAPNNGTAPTVTITEDANDDGFINKAELNGAVDVKIAFSPAQVSSGDVVKVTSGGVTHDVTITDTDKANGFVISSFTTPADGTTMVVNAVIVDKAGNVSANGSDEAQIDTTAPNNGTAPTVTITEDANDDGLINKTELNGAVDVKIAFAPAQVSAGDVVKVTSGGVTHDVTITDTDKANGFVTSSFAAPADGTTMVVNAVIVDKAGNVSANGSDEAQIDTVAPNNGTAPTVTITEDANNDGFINKAELNGAVDVKIAFTPTQVSTGDVVKVTSAGVTHDVTITDTDKTNGFVTSSFAAPADGTTMVVNAVIVDKAGNVSANGSDSAKLDTTDPTVLTAKLDPTSDSGTIGDGITNDATPTISGTGDPQAVIKVTMPGTGEVLTTTVQPDGTWTVTPTQTIPNGTSGPAQVTETDAAGNTTQTSVQLAIDTGVPNNGAAPTVTITEDANNDGFINKAELNGAVDVKVAFTPAQVSAGDVVKVTSGGVTHDVTITDTDKANGFVTSSFAAPTNGTVMTVTAYIKDAAGNSSNVGQDQAKLDLSTLQGLGITLSTDANNDGFINKAELGSGQTVSAQITLPADAAAGDALNITATGNAPQTIILTQAQIDAGAVTVGVTAPASGTDLVVSAQVSDAAGNQSALVSDHAIVATDDISAPKVSITTDTNNDALISKAELNGGNAIGVQVNLPGTAKVGDSLLVSVNGVARAPIVLSQTDIDSHSVAITGVSNPGDGASLAIMAQVKDVAGNLGAIGSDSAKVDATTFTGLGIAITTDANNDGFISKSELAANTIGVRVALPAGAAVGDTLTVNGSGNVAQVLTLTAAQLAAGQVDLTFNPTGDNTDFVATASIADAAGNSAGPVSDTAHLQLGVPGAPIVTITEDANNDGFINQAELSGGIGVSVALPATAKAGDSLLVSANGAAQAPIMLTQADIDKGSVAVPGITNPGEGQTLTVTAQVKDVAGNLGAIGDDSAKIDTTAPTVLTAKLDPASDSGTVGDGITNDATPTISGTGDVGAQIKVTLPGTGEVLTTTVQADGTWTVTPTQTIANGTSGQAQVTETDAAGNTTQTSVQLAIDTGVPNNGAAPTVTITEDANNDGFINKAELNGAVDVKIAFTPAQVSAGDVVKVTSGGVTHDVTISDTDKANGFVTSSFAAPADGTTMVVNAVIVDKAGNVSANGSDSAKIDTTTFTGLGIAITTDANNDGFISKSELAANTIGVRVALPAGAAVGDTLTVNGSGNVAQVLTLTAAQLAAGQVDLTFNPTGDNTDFVATASIADAAGNSAGPVSDTAHLQLGVPGAPIVTITEDANNDGFINQAELSGGIGVSVALPATAKAGDSLLVSANGAAQAPIVLTQADIDKGSVAVPGITNPGEGQTVTVTAQVKDVAGNLGAIGDDSAKIDTTAPTVLTAKLDPSSDSGTVGDGITNDATPTISGTGDVGAQIKVTLPGTGEVLTTTVQADGTWTVTPTQTIANGTSGPAQVTETDAAGNTTQTSVQLAIDTGVPNNGAAPTVTITEDANNDGFINKAELNGAVDVKVAFTPAQVSAGDVVKVTSGGVTHDVTISDTDKANGFVTSSFAAPADGTTMVVNAVIVDKAGNVSANGSDSAKIDTTAPTVLTAKLDPTSDSGTIGDGITNDATPTISGTGDVGAQIKVTLPGTGEVLTTTVQADGTWTVTPTQTIANGTSGPAQVTETDAAGNTTQTSVQLAIDTGVPNNGAAPTVTITEDANNDGFINKAELNGAVDVKVAFTPAQVSAGDVVKVTSGGVTHDVTITDTDKANGFVTSSFTAPADGTTMVVNAVIVDKAGNVSANGSDSAKIDTTAPTVLTAKLDPTSDSGTIGDGITNDATPTISGTGDPQAVIKVTMPGTGEVLTTTVQADGTWTVTPTQTIANGTNGPAQVTETDAAGNTTQTSVQLAIDTGVPNNGAAPTVTITEDANNDGFINKTELNGAVDVKVAFTPAQVSAGDVVKVTSGGVTHDVTISDADKANGFVTSSFTAPADGTAMVVDAVIVDKAGNVSAIGSDTAVVDTTPPILDLDANNSSGATGSGYATTYNEGAAPVRLSDVDISISASHPTQLTGATIKLTNAQAGDVLSVVDALPPGITASVVGNTITLSGTASLAAYQTAIRDLGFASTSHDPATVDRTVEVTVFEGNSIGNTAVSTIHVVAVNDAPVVGTASGSVSEEGLAGGVKDSTGTPDTTDSATFSGHISISDADSAVTSVSLSAPTTVVTAISGNQVVWSSDGRGGLIGKDGSAADAATVFTVGIDTAGNYNAQLLGALKHTGQGEGQLSLTFGVQASDGVATGNGQLTINVEDDAPFVPALAIAQIVTTIDTNLMIVLDTSGSMAESSGISGLTRLQASVQSINNLLDRYDDAGSVAVRLVTFSSSAQNQGASWVTVAQAKTLLAAVVADGGTNYDYALSQAQSAFATSTGKLSGAQNVSYFFSDGNPTLSSQRPSSSNNPGSETNANYGDGIDATEEAAWVKFLNDNAIKSYAVGLGSGVNKTYLDPIAYDGQASENLGGMVVSSLTQLDTVLSSTVTSTASGNLTVSGTAMTAMGADGFDHVASVTVDGITYNYDAANTNLVVHTARGDDVRVDMKTGAYTYVDQGQSTATATEHLSFSLSDKDGDLVSSTLDIQLDRTLVVMGTTGNDNHSATQRAELAMGRDGNDTYVGGGGDDRIYGNGGNDVLSGGGGSDLLNGGAGNDVLNGGDGQDIIVGGVGNDVLTGGAGSDVFAWHFADPGANAASRAVDTIKDFNVAAVNDGGDVLDLRDLLSGENATGGSGNLHNYLDFDTTSTANATILSVSPTGGFTNGVYSASQETQRIVLEGVNLRTDLGLASNATDDQIIVKLLQQGKLLVDG